MQWYSNNINNINAPPRLQGWHSGSSVPENFATFSPQEGEVDDDEAVDDDEDDITFLEESFPSYDAASVVPESDSKPSITKIKSFNLSKPQTLTEAIFALDYVDHDFYVFRNEDGGDVNVIYKRTAGGIGLIQPEQ